MTDTSDKAYNGLREWIKRARNKEYSWETIISKADGSEDDVRFFRNNIESNFWPDNSMSVWSKVVGEVRHVEDTLKRAIERTNRSTLLGPNQKNMLEVPEEEDSCWALYSLKLREKGFTNIETIQSECLNILQSISSDTREDSPVKGLVVGNVQSGKTANMAGLIAMAADHGWNFFIILSGTIDSLRIQTRNRLYGDLKNDELGKFAWQTIDHLNLKNPDHHPTKINLKNDNVTRYLTVCLKNPKRLRDMLRWINYDPKKKSQMKILLIDDEADQASINTAQPDEQRRTINRLIVNLVEGKDAKGNATGRYGAMNYIAYTATPYANFLSEGLPESLYPKDFITLLTPPNLYFGPSEIYGSDDMPGMNVINTYENVDRAIESLHGGTSDQLPDSLKDAVCWFLCCVAILRKQKYSGPCSMLIHTSLYTDHHDNVARAVFSYLTTERSVINKRCETVYPKQTSMLPLDRFFEEYPNFAVPKSKIHNYPPFSEISKGIDELISAEPRHIRMEEEERVYHNGIHLCIDNSKKMIIDDEENSLPRLLYPDENSKNCPSVPAFIVVGGNTLSRGLTVEGLVSTYFARIVAQGDTLMQMGRWFGYRKNYELLPRLWMSDSSSESFREMVKIDNSLREFIRENYNLMTPADFPPKVRKFPGTSYLKRITSPSKMRAAVETDYDFDGTLIETTSFDKSPEIIKANKACTENFIKSLNKPERSEVAEAWVWRGVSGEDIFGDFFSPFKFSERSKNFIMLDSMKKWISTKSDFYNWNVILAGIGDSKRGQWEIGNGVSINKVERGIEKDYGDAVFIGNTLASPIDRVADIYKSNYKSKEDFDTVLKDRSKWRELRAECGLRDVPTLLIYCISKDSEPSSINKSKLDVEEDLIGLTVIMPGVKQTKLKAQYLQIPPSFVRGEE
jgi:hypothetical protein